MSLLETNAPLTVVETGPGTVLRGLARGSKG
jgi:hypothetical protein